MLYLTIANLLKGGSCKQLWQVCQTGAPKLAMRVECRHLTTARAAGGGAPLDRCSEHGCAGGQRTGQSCRRCHLSALTSSTAMQVVHSALGLVRSPVMTTGPRPACCPAALLLIRAGASDIHAAGMQVLSRMWVLWGIILAVPQKTINGAVGLTPLPLELNLNSLLLAWGITEVIRYSFYALKVSVHGSSALWCTLLWRPACAAQAALPPAQLQQSAMQELSIVPYPLLWLRYTTFIVLYPLGVASELAMVYLALPTIRKSKMWSATMPNSLNIGFDYPLLCWAMLAGYIPGETEGQAVKLAAATWVDKLLNCHVAGFPQLYLYMISQRKKMLGSKSK